MMSRRRPPSRIPTRPWSQPGMTCPPPSSKANGSAPRSQEELADAGALPPWLGDPALHRSHQSSLVRKDPAHYRRFFPDVPDDLPYVWPVPEPAA